MGASVELLYCHVTAIYTLCTILSCPPPVQIVAPMNMLIGTGFSIVPFQYRGNTTVMRKKLAAGLIYGKIFLSCGVTLAKREWNLPKRREQKYSHSFTGINDM